MRRMILSALAVLAIGAGLPATALAQGGGASSTGTIQGRVADSSGARAARCHRDGGQPVDDRPADPGDQRERRRIAFRRCRRASIASRSNCPGSPRSSARASRSRSASPRTVNVEMTVATLQETVTVTGASPVIDTTATRVQQNFKLEQLNSIPNGRDMWALLAATPGVVMSRIDVGGNRAGTQTGYTAYGLNGQVRVSVEGINTTEGTGGAGFYFDYGSFEEVFLGVAGQGAEAATPGVQSQFLGKSGGNRLSPARCTSTATTTRSRARTCRTSMINVHGPAPGQQRSAALLRRQRQRRRAVQARQGVVALLPGASSSMPSSSRSSTSTRSSRPGTPTRRSRRPTRSTRTTS